MTDRACLLILALCLLPSPALPAEDASRAARERMVREQIEARDVRDPRVLQALRTVPRHDFVPPEYASEAYQDHPVPIGSGQTISQPYIVALMTELARPQKDDRVLEVGTGSGYQAAVLAVLVKQVFTIELIEELATSARQRLRRMGYKNVEVRQGDGYAGWPEQAPFDKIIVTAAPDRVPPALVEQLKPGGRMVVPVGPRFDQELLVVEKDEKGRVKTRSIIPVSFVPMVKPPDPLPQAWLDAARGELERAQARAARLREAFQAGAATRVEVDAAERAVADAKDRYERLAAGPERLTPAIAAEERRRAEQHLAELREEAERMGRLYEAGVVARREFEAAQNAVREAENFLELARWREQELEHEWELARRVEEWRARGGRFDERTLGSLEAAYLGRFGQPLPISALGMTETHAGLNFDHSGRVDVAVHPDSPEGRWLIQELAARDIPFLVYYGAVPGKATGAHIHLGLPSPPLNGKRTSGRMGILARPGPANPVKRRDGQECPSHSGVL